MLRFATRSSSTDKRRSFAVDINPFTNNVLCFAHTVMNPMRCFRIKCSTDSFSVAFEKFSRKAETTLCSGRLKNRIVTNFQNPIASHRLWCVSCFVRGQRNLDETFASVVFFFPRTISMMNYNYMCDVDSNVIYFTGSQYCIAKPENAHVWGCGSHELKIRKFRLFLNVPKSVLFLCVALAYSKILKVGRYKKKRAC